MPVISTLCPMCGVSFASSVSSRYSLAIAVACGAVVPEVPAVPLASRFAFVRTNLVSTAPVVPLVPVGAAITRR